jgi:hypothetical protein
LVVLLSTVDAALSQGGKPRKAHKKQKQKDQIVECRIKSKQVSKTRRRRARLVIVAQERFSNSNDGKDYDSFS